MSHAPVGLWIAGLLLLAGCQQGGTPTLPQAVDPGLATAALVPVALAPGESLGTVMDVTINPVEMTGTVSERGDRATQAQPPQALSYDLDLTQFLTSAHLRVSSVAKASNGDLLVSIQFDHPFPSPNFAAAISAGNRADLGFTGRVLVLTDQNAASYTVPGEGSFTFPTGMLLNPDGFVATGDLLYRQGFASNLFPYRLLVDEATDNRVGISNEAAMTGNYDPASGGWQRGNAGTPATGWTGYDYIHQGQSAITTLRLNAGDLALSSYSFAIALLAKYTDSRGIPGMESRFPYDPVDVTKFAYRLPFAALDASACTWCNTFDLPGLPHEKTLSVTLRDWDTGAAVGADADLSDEAEVDVVQPGADAAPLVELISPLSATPLQFTMIDGSGLPGDELQYELTIRNESGVDGAGWFFIRARDPEWDDAAFDEYHFGVDPVTLAGDPARAIRPATYMPLRIRAWPGDSWIATLAGRSQSGDRVAATPQNTFLVTHQWNGSGNDASPADCLQELPFSGSGVDTGVIELSAAGEFLTQWSWPTAAYQNNTVSTGDAAGNRYISFFLEDDNWEYAPVTLDLDPGAGVDERTSRKAGVAIIKLDADGNYVWGGVFDNAEYIGTNHQFAAGPTGICPLPGGGLAISGWFYSRIDLDPGSGDAEFAATFAIEWFLVVLDASGNYVWGHVSNGRQGDKLTAPVTLPNGNVLVAGSFRETVDFEPGSGTTNLTTLAQYSAFKAEYTPTGDLVDVVGWGIDGSSNTQVYLAHALADGSSYCMGTFSGSVDFDPGPGEVRHTTTQTIANWVYWSRFAANGTHQWTRVIETLVQPTGYTVDIPRGYAMTSAGRLVYATSVFTEFELDLDPGPGVVSLTSADPRSFFWVSYDADGEYEWHRQVRQDNIFPGITGLALGTDERVLLTISGTIPQDVDPGPAVHALDFREPYDRAGLVLLQADGTF